MEVQAMALHPRERWKLHQIEVILRKDDPGLERLLAGRRPLRRPGPRAQAAWLMVAFLAPVALLVSGLVLGSTWLMVAGGVPCPFLPVLICLLFRRHSVGDRPSHSRKP
ncbi:MAG TPA: DUF3040 domain-containing protein [Trebonia sp.]|jgi:hypothetical protein|nr:DUF3040 domain-containing protein [Trebonia sp.]